MKAYFASALACSVATAAPAFSQAALATAEPVQAVARPAVAASTALPANTEIMVSMNEELTTKGGRIDEGHRFGLTVVHDVTVGDFVVIPRGTPAFGEVTWKTGKGAFGKSGKMDIELRYIDLNGRRIPVSGKYRQEGEGNTVATIGGVLLAGVFAGFVTGKSARIPQGRELKAFTIDALPVALPARAAAPAAVQAVPVADPAAAPPAEAAPAIDPIPAV
jgi:hypothetical protein